MKYIKCGVFLWIFFELVLNDLENFVTCFKSSVFNGLNDDELMEKITASSYMYQETRAVTSYLDFIEAFHTLCIRFAFSEMFEIFIILTSTWNIL